jgi:plasmid stability protein
MPQVLIRELDERTVQRLKLRARQHGRSLEAELRTILQASAEAVRQDPRPRVDQARALFAGRAFADSADLIRADRDR